ncbi:MAG: acyl-CoA/acyl-ACP dehydrogenase [Chloroflexi bacterium]|nr:acyl-CoA/acyl-ACP dehydrogenase [Chloroflexota bacterium]
MDLAIPDDIISLRASLGHFVEEELIPLEPKLQDLEEPDPEERSRLVAKVKAQGLWALDMPTKYGGGGVNTVGSFLFREEASRTYVPSALSSISLFGLDQHPIVRHCSEAQIDEFLAPVVRGEKRTAYLLTGPAGGSDLSNISTSATRQDGRWILSGQNVFATDANKADFVQVFATTDKDAGIEKAITCFLVDTSSPGFRVERVAQMLLPNNACEVILEECEVPEDRVLGGLGQGSALSQELLTVYGARCGPVSLGIGRRCQEMAMAFAKRRMSFGERIGNRQSIQLMLADSAIEMHAARVLTYECAGKMDRGEDVRKEASIVKFFSTEMVGRVVDRAVQIHGSLGLSKDLPLERFYRDVRALRIAHGGNEIHRKLVAEDILGL